MHPLPRLYTDLAEWWPVMSDPEEYAGEAGWYRQLLQEATTPPPVTVLELGSGGGHNASHLKAAFQMTLVDLAPDMLAVSRELNPECEHVEGDMRKVRLGRQFDAVFVHDAICYMTTEADLRQAMETAFAHLRPGGAALFCPDITRERFRPDTDHGGHDGEDRAMRYLEWTWDPDPADTSYRTDFAYLLRDAAGTVTAVEDTHILGLFAEADWLRLLAEAGFQPEIRTSDLPDFGNGIGGVVFLGTRPGKEDNASLTVAGPWEQVLAAGQTAPLEAALPAYMLPRRWFASKARTLAEVRIVDVVPVDGLAQLALVRMACTTGEPETYVVPLAFAAGAEAETWLEERPMAVVARLATPEGEGLLYDAVWSPAFCQRLLDLVGEERTLPGYAGAVTSSATAAYPALRGDPAQPLTPHLLGVEQSNTNVRFDRQLLMKLFRRLEPGINPDLEIGTFLTERAHFAHVPPVAGALLYHPGAGVEPATLAIVQGFVPNRGDAWRYALDALDEYLARADGPLDLPEGSLLDLAAGPIPAAAGERIGPFLDSARLLGRRTAELHLALASDPDDPAFAPEPFTGADRRHLHEEMSALTGRIMDLLRANVAGLPEAALPEARAVLAQEQAILQQFDALLAGEISALRIRIHGDYHLGQVLVAGDDFMIIDFEGEPARPLAARRQKRAALQDVAGMLRSFHYAAYAAYFDAIERAPDDAALLENWARYWHRWVSAAYLQSYLEVAEGAAILPASEAELAALLDAFLLEKAVYELGYELNNRPHWVRIPLQGIQQTARQAP